jgi:hypothetical protein
MTDHKPPQNARALEKLGRLNRTLRHQEPDFAGIGDGFERNTPPWIDIVKKLRADFPVYGSMTEAAECLTRLIGQMNTILWIGGHPERMGRQDLRLHRQARP